MGRIHFTTHTLRAMVLLLGISFCFHEDLSAQVKIGENPQTIDGSSILELESNELVLVITRVTTQQMNTLTPIAGALVYNTDVGCVDYSKSMAAFSRRRFGCRIDTHLKIKTEGHSREAQGAYR